jgi:hypothetical protein
MVFDPAGLGPAIWLQQVPETKARRTQFDDPDDPVYFVVMHDPEGNEFCVG